MAAQSVTFSKTMEQVQQERQSVEAEIQKVGKEIDDVAEQLSVADLLDEDKRYLRQEKFFLRQKEDRLRQEKDRLREEELIYLKKTQALSSSSKDTAVTMPSIDTKAIGLLEDMHKAFVTRDRATPQKTPASHGKTEYFRLEREGKVKTFNAIDSEPSILSLSQMGELSKLQTEHQIVAFMTPHFENIFGGDEESTTVVVNSEEFKWLKTSDDTNYNQKPDLFVCHRAIYKDRDPFNCADTTLLKMRRKSDIFGTLADWKLRRFLYVVCEAKKKIDNAALGETINYGSHLCFEDDGPVTIRLVLFDVKEFWLVEVVKGTASSIEKCKWSTGGSLSLFQKFALRDPLIEVLDKACRHFGLTVEKDSFLGQGAFGVVFRVKNHEGRLLAMKIVPDESSNVRDLKMQKQMTELAKSKCPECVVGVEEDGFFHFPHEAGVLLLSEVGDHYSTLSAKKIADSLEALHMENILHGDCRVENIVNVNGEARWIDFRTGQYFHSEDVSTEKATEKKSLQESLLRAFSFYD